MGITDVAHQDWGGIVFQAPQAPMSESVLAERGVDPWAKRAHRRDPLLQLTAAGQQRPLSAGSVGGSRGHRPLIEVASNGNQRSQLDGPPQTARSFGPDTARPPSRTQATAPDSALVPVAEAGGVVSTGAGGAGAGSEQPGDEGGDEGAVVAVQPDVKPVTRFQEMFDGRLIAKTRKYADIIVDEEFGRSLNQVGSTVVRPARYVGLALRCETHT